MSGALVLNATYEPLGVVATRRALCLVLAGRADMLDHDGGLVRSERAVFASPSVIRLRKVVRVPYRCRTSLSRRALFLRDEHCCQYCGDHADSVDHVVPRSRGGRNEWENLVAACRPCNLRKRDRTPEEANMALARLPVQPRESSWVSLSVACVPDAWKPYLAVAS